MQNVPFSLRRRNRQQGNLPRTQGTNPGSYAETDPKLPHEHDESADSQRGQSSKSQHVVRQAKQDVEQGILDTDRRGAYGMGEGQGLQSRAARENQR